MFNQNHHVGTPVETINVSFYDKKADVLPTLNPTLQITLVIVSSQSQLIKRSFEHRPKSFKNLPHLVWICTFLKLPNCGWILKIR